MNIQRFFFFIIILAALCSYSVTAANYMYENATVKNRCTFDFTSDPSGASVYVDNVNIGTTPISNRLVLDGYHKFEIKKTGYRADPSGPANPLYFTCAAGADYSMHRRLVSTFNGTWGYDNTSGSCRFDFTSDPSGALVYIDNANIGTTPLYDRPVSAGYHKFEIKKSGFSADPSGPANPLYYTCERGQDYSMHRTLVPASSFNGTWGYDNTSGSCRFDFTSDPSGALVYIDNTNIGTTPLYDRPVSAGYHKFEIKKSGFSADPSGPANPQYYTCAAGADYSMHRTLVPASSFNGTWGNTSGFCRFDFTSDPSGATVYIDNANIGTTPLYDRLVSAGYHKFEIKKSGFSADPSGPANPQYYTCAAGADYSMHRNLIGGSPGPTIIPTTLPTPGPSGTGTVMVSSTPGSAFIYIDGAFKGFTPLTISAVSAGTHQLKLTKTGYQEYTTSVTVTGGATTPVSATLTSSSGTPGTPTPVPTTAPTPGPVPGSSGTGTVMVSSTPGSAFIYIDGAFKGFTPMTISGVSAGTHQVKLTKTGYQEYTTSVTVTGGATSTVSVTLTSGSGTPGGPTVLPTTVPTTAPTSAPVPGSSGTGTVMVSSTPGSAFIYIDGAFKGFTPMTISGVSAGTHQVKLTKTGYQEYTTSVTVAGGATSTVSVTLTSGSGTPGGPTILPTTVPTTAPTSAPVPGSSGTGTVMVSSTPGSAFVYLDGSFKGFTPMTISGVSAGTHQLKLTKTGYQEYTTSVTVTGGTTTPVSVTLTVKPIGSLGLLIPALMNGR